jgi:hypothetical protein
MAYSSIARTYANVNRDAPKSYWDYGTLLSRIWLTIIDNLQVTWGYTGFGDEADV